VTEKSYNDIDWKDFFLISSSSPSGLLHKINRKHVKKGDSAGTNHHSKCWIIRLFGKNYQVHRVIWVLLHGSISDELVVDHLDGNGLNNEINNLSLKSSKENSQNRGINKNNTSGFSGVHFSLGKCRGAWYTSWRDITGKKKIRSFSVAKYGFNEAMYLAVTLRKEQLALLNENGQNYTERHIESKT